MNNNLYLQKQIKNVYKNQNKIYKKIGKIIIKQNFYQQIIIKNIYKIKILI